MAYHAKRSPSGADKWMVCAGSLVLEEGCPDKPNPYADEGTAAHLLGDTCLSTGDQAVKHIGRTIIIGPKLDGTGESAEFETARPTIAERVRYEVTPEMASNVQQYLDAVRMMSDGGALFVEQDVPISDYTLEEGATGRSDAIAITPGGELQIHDLKYGRQAVPPGRQLKLYALGAVKVFGDFQEFDKIRLVIHQPRAGGVSEEVLMLPELLEFGEEVRGRAHVCDQVAAAPDTVLDYLHPGEKQCQWCRAKATCPALEEEVREAIEVDFDDVTEDLVEAPKKYTEAQLSAKMAACDLIEDWIKAVRARVESELLAGRPVPGYKLVQGKRGNRAWSDPAAAEAMLKGFRLKIEEIYDMKLISPTTADKLMGPKGSEPSPRRWAKLSELITQAEGAPHVAPESDKRPALTFDASADFDSLN